MTVYDAVFKKEQEVVEEFSGRKLIKMKLRLMMGLFWCFWCMFFFE